MNLEKLIEIRHDLLKGVESYSINDVMWAINDLDTLIFKERNLLDLKEDVLREVDKYKATTEEPKREFKERDIVRITGNNTYHCIPLETVCVLEFKNTLGGWLIWHSGRRYGVLESDMEHTT